MARRALTQEELGQIQLDAPASGRRALAPEEMAQVQFDPEYAAEALSTADTALRTAGGFLSQAEPWAEVSRQQNRDWGGTIVEDAQGNQGRVDHDNLVRFPDGRTAIPGDPALRPVGRDEGFDLERLIADPRNLDPLELSIGERFTRGIADAAQRNPLPAVARAAGAAWDEAQGNPNLIGEREAARRADHELAFEGNNFWEADNLAEGASEAVVDLIANLAGAAPDPVNLIGPGGPVGQGANRLASFGARALAQGGVNVAGDAIAQAADVSSGSQEEYSAEQALISGLVGTGLYGAINAPAALRGTPSPPPRAEAPTGPDTDILAAMAAEGIGPQDPRFASEFAARRAAPAATASEPAAAAPQTTPEGWEEVQAAIAGQAADAQRPAPPEIERVQETTAAPLDTFRDAVQRDPNAGYFDDGQGAQYAVIVGEAGDGQLRVALIEPDENGNPIPVLDGPGRPAQRVVDAEAFTHAFAPPARGVEADDVVDAIAGPAARQAAPAPAQRAAVGQDNPIRGIEQRNPAAIPADERLSDADLIAGRQRFAQEEAAAAAREAESAMRRKGAAAPEDPRDLYARTEFGQPVQPSQPLTPPAPGARRLLDRVRARADLADTAPEGRLPSDEDVGRAVEQRNRAQSVEEQIAYNAGQAAARAAREARSDADLSARVEEIVRQLRAETEAEGRTYRGPELPATERPPTASEAKAAPVRAGPIARAAIPPAETPPAKVDAPSPEPNRLEAKVTPTNPDALRGRQWTVDAQPVKKADAPKAEPPKAERTPREQAADRLDAAREDFIQARKERGRLTKQEAKEDNFSPREQRARENVRKAQEEIRKLDEDTTQQTSRIENFPQEDSTALRDAGRLQSRNLEYDTAVEKVRDARGELYDALNAPQPRRIEGADGLKAYRARINRAEAAYEAAVEALKKFGPTDRMRASRADAEAKAKADDAEADAEIADAIAKRETKTIEADRQTRGADDRVEGEDEGAVNARNAEQAESYKAQREAYETGREIFDEWSAARASGDAARIKKADAAWSKHIDKVARERAARNNNNTLNSNPIDRLQDIFLRNRHASTIATEVMRSLGRPERDFRTFRELAGDDRVQSVTDWTGKTYIVPDDRQRNWRSRFLVEARITKADAAQIGHSDEIAGAIYNATDTIEMRAERNNYDIRIPEKVHYRQGQHVIRFLNSLNQHTNVKTRTYMRDGTVVEVDGPRDAIKAIQDAIDRKEYGGVTLDAFGIGHILARLRGMTPAQRATRLRNTTAVRAVQQAIKNMDASDPSRAAVWRAIFNGKPMTLKGTADAMINLLDTFTVADVTALRNLARRYPNVTIDAKMATILGDPTLKGRNLIQYVADQVGSDISINEKSGRVVGQAFQREGDQIHKIFSNRIERVLGTKPLTDDQNDALRTILTEPSFARGLNAARASYGAVVTPELVRQARQVREAFDDMWRLAQATGLKLGSRKGYLTRIFDLEKINKQQGAFKAAAADAYQASDPNLTRAEADAMATTLTHNLLYPANRNIGAWNAVNQGATPNPMAQRKWNADADHLVKDFYRTDLREITAQYGRSLGHLIAYEQRFGKTEVDLGNGPEVVNKMTAISEAIREQMGFDNAGDFYLVKRHLEAALGMSQGAPHPEEVQALLALSNVLGMARLLGRVFIPQIGEPAALAARQNKGALTALGHLLNSARFYFDAGGDDVKRAKLLAHYIGVIGQAANQNMIAARIEGVPGGIWHAAATNLMNFNSVAGLTERQRIMGVHIGQRAVREAIDDFATGGKHARAAAELLSEYGIDQQKANRLSVWLQQLDQLPEEPRLEAIAYGEYEEARLYRAAISDFANKSIVEPTAADTPMYAKHPAWRLGYALTSFMHAFTREHTWRAAFKADRALTDGSLSLQQRAMILGAAPMAWAAYGVTQVLLDDELRDRFFSRRRSSEQSDFEETVENISRLGGFGNQDALANFFLQGARYDKDPATLMVGAYVGTQMQDIFDVIQAMPTSPANSPNTERAEWQGAKAIYQGALAPAAVLAAAQLPVESLPAPVRIPAKVAGALAGAFVTSSDTARGFADAVVGDEGPKPRKPREVNYDSENFGETPAQKRRRLAEERLDREDED